MEMKRKLKIMTHQVDQLKEEISAKEPATHQGPYSRAHIHEF